MFYNIFITIISQAAAMAYAQACHAMQTFVSRAGLPLAGHARPGMHETPGGEVVHLQAAPRLAGVTSNGQVALGAS